LSKLSSTSPDNKIKVRYTNDNQGFLDHKHKFKLALDALPDSCKLLHEGSFTNTSSTSRSFTHDIVADFEARKSVFYADFNKDDNYSSVLKSPEVNRDLLVKAVNDFLMFIRAQKYP